jgi:SAM-dependent methyltransferase
MDTRTIAIEAEVEATHWWFVQRRRLFATEIKRINLSADAAILDIGTGTGANLRLLKEMGFRNVVGLDASPDAIRFCELKGLAKVNLGTADAMPFSDKAFDFIMATDVIEHIDDDRAALRDIARVLRPGGSLLLTVPAFQELWGLQDDKSHHKRRYRLSQLVRLVREAPFELQKSFYFNYLLFVPIWLARGILKFLPHRLDSENQVNNAALNAVLSSIFRLDVQTASFLHPPFGVSIMVMARKAQDASDKSAHGTRSNWNVR